MFNLHTDSVRHPFAWRSGGLRGMVGHKNNIAIYLHEMRGENWKFIAIKESLLLSQRCIEL